MIDCKKFRNYQYSKFALLRVHRSNVLKLSKLKVNWPLRLFLFHHYCMKAIASDHRGSKELNPLISLTLRKRNYVSSSWFDRLRISDRKFVNHTTEMIL